MKLRSVALVLLGILISSVILNSLYNDRYNKIENSLKSELEKASNESAYLERCMRFQADLYNQQLSTEEAKDIIIYSPNAVCASCIEELLHIMSNEYDIKDRIALLLEDSSKIELIKSLNDVFQYSYDFAVESLEVEKKFKQYSDL